MTANPLERAVIEAARSWRTSVQCQRAEGFHGDLVDAIDALDAYERSRQPAVKEIGWHEVAAGDELRSVNNGRFYPVLSALKLVGGKYRITLEIASTRKMIERPTEKEPAATVRRGPDGSAVDVFVNVFMSGSAQ